MGPAEPAMLTDIVNQVLKTHPAFQLLEDPQLNDGTYELRFGANPAFAQTNTFDRTHLEDDLRSAFHGRGVEVITVLSRGTGLVVLVR